MVYKQCKDCDELYEVVFDCSSGGNCSCGCNGLEIVDPKTADWKTEKHVPVVEKVDGGIKVFVGSTLHPMTDDHWITMIEVQKGDLIMRKSLNPGDEPIAIFPIDDVDVIAREYCNKHGLWANK